MKIPSILKHLADVCGEHSKFETACVRVELDPDGTPWAVATDGRILFAATFRPPEGSPPPGAPVAAHVPAKLWTLAHALAKAVSPVAERERALTVDWSGPALESGEALRLALPLVGKFPLWRKIFGECSGKPHADSTALHGQYVRCRLDAVLLLRACTILHSMGLDIVDWHIPVYDPASDPQKAGPGALWFEARVGEPWATPLADVKVRGVLSPMQWREQTP